MVSLFGFNELNKYRDNRDFNHYRDNDNRFLLSDYRACRSSSSSAWTSYSYTAPETTYELTPTDVKLKYIALNIISFGLWNYYQRKQFKAALLNNDVSKASEIFSKCVIKEIGENLLKNLIEKQNNEALYLIANKDRSFKIADFIFKILDKPQQLDDFLSHLPPLEAACLVKSYFGKKDIEKTTVIFMKYGLTISDIEKCIEEQIWDRDLRKPTEYNLRLLKFYLDIGINPNTGFLLNEIISHLPSSIALSYRPGEYAEIFKIAKEMVQLLLEKGANPNLGKEAFFSVDYYPLSSIIERCPMGLEIAELLLKHNADPNKENNKGYSIFENALFESNCAKLISMMYEKGGRTSTTFLDRVFESIVHKNYSELNRDIAISDKLKLLKSYGGKISHEKCTKAFNLAIKAQDRELAHFLKENGADTSKFDEFVQYVRN